MRSKIKLGAILCGLVMLGIAVCIASQKNKTVHITLGIIAESNWGVPSGTVYEIVDGAIQIFEADHPGVKVSYTSGILKEDYAEWLSEQILLGKEPDVFMVFSQDFETLASLGVLCDLKKQIDEDSEFIPANFYEAAYTYGQWRGQQFALPFESVPTLMFVNKSLLQREGIAIPQNDWTWQEFYEICNKVTKDTDGDGMVDQFGCFNYTWKHAAYSNQCRLFDEDGKVCFAAEANLEEAVQFVGSINQLSQGYTVRARDFDLGKVAFQPLLFSEYSTYMPYPWKIKKYTNFEWDCITLPAGPQGANVSELDTLLMGISARTREKELAWEFLKLMTYDDRIQENIFHYSQGVSVLKNVTGSEHIGNELAEGESSESNLDMAVLNRIMENAAVTPKFQKYKGAMQLMEEGITDAINGERNIHTSLITLQRKLNNYLKN